MKTSLGRIALTTLALMLAPTGAVAQDSAQTQANELAALRERLEAQERQLQQQQKEIEGLKAAVGQLVSTNTQTTGSPGSNCNASDTHNCTPGLMPNAAVVTATASVPPQGGSNASPEQNGNPRFMLGGDVRLRFEPIFQELTPTRYRTRLRVRLGVEATLNQDLKGGFYLASGALDDPVSTNVTLTQFFTRKSIGIDRGWITYQPVSHQWLEVTGGKFAPNWQRTSMSLDPDLNPEGMQEKLSFEINNSVVKKVSLSGMQLLFNELPGAVLPMASGSDSYAFGGQLGLQLQLGRRVKTALYGSGINWQNTDSIIEAITARTLAGNRNTNATIGSGADVQFASKFLYANAIADTTVDTGLPRWPLRITLDFLDNPRAATNQRQAFWGEVGVGHLEHRNDLLFGYSFGRIEQDAVIAAFNESEMRAPTNVLQHRLLLQWLAQKNTNINFTAWIGRTLNRNLQNAAIPPTLPPGEHEPWLTRLQLDLLYKF